MSVHDNMYFSYGQIIMMKTSLYYKSDKLKLEWEVKYEPLSEHI